MITLAFSCEDLECEQDQNLHLRISGLPTALPAPQTHRSAAGDL